VSTSAAGNRAQGFAMLAFTATAWGLNWPVLKFALAEFHPFTFRAMTGLAGVGLLLALAVLRGDRLRPPAGQWGWLALSGVLNVTSMMGLATLALLWLQASEAVIVAYTMPIWTTLLAWPILGERPSLRGLLGLALGFAGVLILVAGQVFGAEAAALASKLPGFALITGTALMFALGTIVTKRHPILMPPVPMVAWQIAFGMLPLLIAAVLLERWDVSGAGTWGWISLIYVVVIALCGSYLAWFRALRLLPASTAAVGILLVPVIGVLSSAVVLGEPLGVRHVLSLVCTVTGVALASRS